MSNEEPSEAGRPESGRRFSRGTFILVALGALAVIFFSYIAYLTVSLPPVSTLQETNPQKTALMRQREREAEREGKPARQIQQWVTLDRISNRLVQSVLMAEDAGFYGHSGFDFHEIRESIRRNWEEGSPLRGASTITQQLAKNLYLSTDRSYHRKIKEAILTRRLERDLSKKRILEIYLNVIEWGDGIYGAEAAAREYFGKPASRVDAAEAALMAAMIPNPRRLQPSKSPRALRTRQERVLRWMHGAGYLTESELVEALERNLLPGGAGEG